MPITESLARPAPAGFEVWQLLGHFDHGNCKLWKGQSALDLTIRLAPFRTTADKGPQERLANWASFLLTVL